MLLKNRLYPYPIITQFESTTSYLDNKFILSYEDPIEDEQNNILKISFKYDLDQPTLCKLIDESKCQVILLINCSSTSYRKVFVFDGNELTISFKRTEFVDKVEICGFIVACEEIINFAPENLKGKAKGRSYYIENHDILGIDEAEPLNVSYNPKDAKSIQSIFSVQKDTTQNELLKIDLDTNPKKITIHVPSVAYDLYFNSKDNIEITSSVYHSILLLSPLTQVLMLIKNSNFEDLDSVEETFKWFSSIRNSFKKAYNREMVEDDLLNLSSDTQIFEMAQRMLGYCGVNAIESYYRALTNTLNVGGNENG